MRWAAFGKGGTKLRTNQLEAALCEWQSDFEGLTTDPDERAKFDWASFHREGTFVTLGPKCSENSNAESAPPSSATDDPMLPAMNGLEEAMLKQADYWISKNTEQQPQAPSPSSDDTTPPSNAAPPGGVLLRAGHEGRREEPTFPGKC